MVARASGRPARPRPRRIPGPPPARTPWTPGPARPPPPCRAGTTAQTPWTPAPAGPRPSSSHPPPARSRRCPPSPVRRRSARTSPRPPSSHRRTRPLPPIPSGTPPASRERAWPPSTTWHRRPPPTARPHRPVPPPSAAAPPRGAFMPFHPPRAGPPCSNRSAGRHAAAARQADSMASSHAAAAPCAPGGAAPGSPAASAALAAASAHCRMPPAAARAVLFAPSALPDHIARSRSASARIAARLSAHAALPPGHAPPSAHRAAFFFHMRDAVRVVFASVSAFGPPARRPRHPARLRGPPAERSPALRAVRHRIRGRRRPLLPGRRRPRVRGRRPKRGPCAPLRPRRGLERRRRILKGRTVHPAVPSHGLAAGSGRVAAGRRRLGHGIPSLPVRSPCGQVVHGGGPRPCSGRRGPHARSRRSGIRSAGRAHAGRPVPAALCRFAARSGRRPLGADRRSSCRGPLCALAPPTRRIPRRCLPRRGGIECRPAKGRG